MIKRKIYEVAKDINKTSKEIINFLNEFSPSETNRKHNSSIFENEINLVLEYFSKDDKVDNIQDYLVKNNINNTEEKNKEKLDSKSKNLETEKSKNNKKDDKINNQKNNKNNTQENQVNKFNNKNNIQENQVNKFNNKNNTRENQVNKFNNKNNTQENQVNKFNNKNNNQNKKEHNFRNNKNESLDIKNNNKFNNKNENKNNFDRKNFNRKLDNNKKLEVIQDKKNIINLEVKSWDQNKKQPEKNNNKKLQKKQVTAKTVDMRTSDVNLDKYNEKYEQMASQKSSVEYSKKQKINQKSNQRNKQQFNKKESEAEKLKRLEEQRKKTRPSKIVIPEELVVGELASKLKVPAAQVIKKLLILGVIANVSQTIDYNTASLIAQEFDVECEKEVVITIEERLFDETEDKKEDLLPRSPVVVVMGHVDHGKTSLLDAIRDADVISTEAGGITQHIGAYRVCINDSYITFLDTPGHEAFTSMRARGAQITDIAILVVAADDGIMPQTIEAINHAKAAGVSIIVAINKIDKPGANVDKVKQALMDHELIPEEWGGDVICVPISAKKRENINTLLEMVSLVAEVKDLKANPNRLAKGTVIEARLDKGRGPVATVLVQNGTLKRGDIIIAGTSIGKVRVMRDEHSNRIETAGPSVPVEITGLSEVPSAGDVFNAVENEKLAKELVDKRKHDIKQEKFNSYQKVTLDNLFSQISQGEMKELLIIVKADVNGSVEAIKQSLEKLSNQEVRVKVIHGGVGAINKSDVGLATASNAIIVGFNVRPDAVAKQLAEINQTDIRLYRVIYDAIEEIKSAMKGMLAPKTREVDLGRAEIRKVYKISNIGTVAGCYVLDGKILRNSKIRVVRDGIIISDDEIRSLRRVKDDVKEVATGFECGIALEKFADIKEGDILESYIIEEYRD